MSATLSLYSLTLAHGDATANNNPSLRFVDWKRQLSAVAVENPKTEALKIAPGVEKLIFDGTRSTSLDGSTAFDLTLSPLAPDRYRLTHSGGTNPVLRVDRALDLSTIALTMTALANGSLQVVAGSGTPFTAVQVGDEVLIPGSKTGDGSSPFNVSNQGRWLVIGSAPANLTLVRPGGEDFEGLSEVVTPAAAAEFQAYGSAGVQVGDKLRLSAGFNPAALKTYEIVAVSSKYLEVLSSAPLAPQAGVVPGISGLQIYTSGKRFLRIEADQACVVRANGDTGSTQEIEPWSPGDPEGVGEYVKVGPCWSLKIFNRSGSTLNVTIISAE
jgi:hypothetical protein